MYPMIIWKTTLPQTPPDRARAEKTLFSNTGTHLPSIALKDGKVTASNRPIKKRTSLNKKDKVNFSFIIDLKRNLVAFLYIFQRKFYRKNMKKTSLRDRYKNTYSLHLACTVTRFVFHRIGWENTTAKIKQSWRNFPLPARVPTTIVVIIYSIVLFDTLVEAV